MCLALNCYLHIAPIWYSELVGLLFPYRLPWHLGLRGFKSVLNQDSTFKIAFKLLVRTCSLAGSKKPLSQRFGTRAVAFRDVLGIVAWWLNQ